MKQLMSAFALAALLVAGLAVLQPAANAQTQGARSVPLYLDNTETVSSSLTGKQTVAVSVKAVNNCQPRTTLIAGGEYTLQPQGTDPVSNDQIAGILDSHCNYEITYADAAGQCPVNVSLIDKDGNGVGSVISNQRPIAVNVDYNNGDITSNGSAAFVRVHFVIDRSDSNACGTTFKPRVDITIPNTMFAGQSVYKDAVIAVEFTPVATGSVGCETVKAQMEVNAAGVVVWKAAVAGQAASAPDLVHISRAEIERSGADIGCRYTASFTPAEPAGTNLALQTAGLKTNVRSRENADTTSQVDRATARYGVKTVPVSATATFPADEVFTTDDKVTVEVNVIKPCGGTIAVIPEGIWKQSDSATGQIFPGVRYLYGSQLNDITVSEGTYSVPSYADTAGTQPCSVTASVSLEGEAKNRCSAAMASQTDRYAAGTDRIAFSFAFTCTEASAAEETETSEADTPSLSDSPPSPPVIRLGDTAGPLPEGRTG